MTNWLLNEESGQGMVEYALVLILISVVAIAVLGNIGNTINNRFHNINNALNNAPTP